ncbi:hypothetical protein PYCC9005_001174 [Savitreella phatthalungensis]
MASTSSELPSPALEPGVSEAVAVPVVWSSPFVPFRSGGVSSILLDLLLIESASTFQRVMSANALKAVSQTNPAILDGVKHAVDDVGGRGNYTRTVVGEGGERLPVLASTHPVEEEVGVVGRRKRAACALETALEAVGFRVGNTHNFRPGATAAHGVLHNACAGARRWADDGRRRTCCWAWGSAGGGGSSG